ncbi:MAG: ATP-dependent zinc metalloprotease FtsH 4 [Chroococcopsis gigantea SAG 12.99]|jgi:cell division protease FtsH|nr:ATP-dependent zinc metalloprotease FtsH [Chlorogloea purpurea SAG 13.99]MDV3000808.1 ATP-dependent zinc metalloprotease FtsH 4 [Chroococcopsis gigantea SAG 12.99]
MANKNNKFSIPRLPPVGNLLLILAGIAFLGYLFYPRSSDNPEVPVKPYSEFLQSVDRGQVARVKIGNALIIYQLKSPLELFQEKNTIPENPLKLGDDSHNPFHSSIQTPTSTENTNNQGQVLAVIPVDNPGLPALLQTKNVMFEAAPPPSGSWINTLLAWIVPPIVLVAAMQFLIYRNDDTRKSLLFNKNLAKVYPEGEGAQISFADVAGADEAKTELKEIVEFLKDPERFNKIGARIPKGVLLVGPPGTGKTLLAKAVAGEAGVTFFSISASEFVELYVGTGAARVRDLFAQAKENAPSIVFIDELDAIGKSRSSGQSGSGSNDEREQTLNQLLTEMDGFNAKEAVVIVLAATNRPETLDQALLRPGRFDRQVLVDRPDLIGRLAILDIYSKRVKIGPDVDLKTIATQTPGFAGADLANLVNEAALLAARNGRESVSQPDFKEAIERVVAGLEKKSRVLNAVERRIVAYHEVGHALIGAVMPGGGKVEKISIVPRGLSALGYTLKMPTEDRFLMTEPEFREQITMLLGGRAAEQIVFGSVTNGASDDLQRATTIAEKMVTIYGMSKNLGPIAYEKTNGNNFLNNGNIHRRSFSEDTAKIIDEEVKGIVDSSYEKALFILQENRELLETITQKLLTTEVLEGEELNTLLNQATSH